MLYLQRASGSSPTWTWYDSLGRAIVTQSYGFEQPVDIPFHQYDSQGRVWRISEPTFNNTPGYLTEARVLWRLAGKYINHPDG